MRFHPLCPYSIGWNSVTWCPTCKGSWAQKANITGYGWSFSLPHKGQQLCSHQINGLFLYDSSYLPSFLEFLFNVSKYSFEEFKWEFSRLSEIDYWDPLGKTRGTKNSKSKHCCQQLQLDESPQAFQRDGSTSSTVINKNIIHCYFGQNCVSHRTHMLKP